MPVRTAYMTRAQLARSGYRAMSRCAVLDDMIDRLLELGLLSR